MVANVVLVLILMNLVVSQTQSGAEIKSSKQCNQCFSQQGKVCRHKILDTTSFCCGLSDDKLSELNLTAQTPGSCSSSTTCSDKMSDKHFSCPYDYQLCDGSRGNIELAIN